MYIRVPHQDDRRPLAIVSDVGAHLSLGCGCSACSACGARPGPASHALGQFGRALRQEALTTVADADSLTDLEEQVRFNLQTLKWGVHHAALHVRNRFNIDRAALVPTTILIAASKGFQQYSRGAINRLLRKAGAKLNGRSVTADEIERQFQKRSMLPIKPGTSVWCTVLPPLGARVVAGLGPPPGGVKAALHEGMHALSNPLGVQRVALLDEGGAEYFSRQAARAQGLSYSKSYPDQEALFGKLVTDLGEPLIAQAFFGNGLPAFEIAFDKKYGAGRLQHFIDEGSTSVMKAARVLGLDYETMTDNRP